MINFALPFFRKSPTTLRKLKSPDINTIARQSGVSIATVSRVLNNEHGVSDEVRRKTLDIMRQHGYQPRSNAKRTTRLGMVLQNENPAIDPFLSEILSGIFRYASEQNIETTLIHHKLNSSASLVEYLRRKRCNGALILIAGNANPNAFGEARIPAMYISNRREADGVGYIDCDGFESTLVQMNYLIRLGHRRIAYLAGEMEQNVDHQERMAAYYHAMKEARLELDPGWVVPFQAGPTEQRAYESTRKLLAAHPEITVIFANSDALAWGAICAAVEMGRRVPEDLSVVGYDDHPSSAYYNPPLTTVRQPLGEMAYEAARAVDQKVRGRLEELPRKILKGELIVRRSCAPPRSNP